MPIPLQIIEQAEVQTEKIFNWLDKVGDMALEYAPRIIGAIIIYLVGAKLIGWATRSFVAFLHKREVDPALRTFLSSFVRIGLFALLLIAIVGMVGVPITGFAAIIAGMAFGVGSALNGSLGNVAGGIVILVTRPFNIGDLIKAQDHFGIVTEIGIIDTVLLTSQNKTIHLPNGALSTGVIENFTDQETLRIDINFYLLDESSFEFAKKVAIEAMESHPDVVKDPAPNVRIAELSSNGPVLVLWPHIKIKPYDKHNPRQLEKDYYSVFFGVKERVYEAFVKNGIQTQDNTHQVTMMSPK